MVKVKISDWKADSSMDEAYKALRTNIQFCGADKKVIAFTSCTPNEGKSNVTFHLAASLAESGKSVLLIDADLRKSVLMGRVQVEEEVKGLTHYLSKQAKLQDVICATNLPKFHIIFSGVVPPNPAELLGSRQFKDMIRVVRYTSSWTSNRLCSCGGFLRWNCHCNRIRQYQLPFCTGDQGAAGEDQLSDYRCDFEQGRYQGIR